MRVLKEYRFRKCSDIELDKVYYEVFDAEGHAVMDLSLDDSDKLNVLFYPAIANYKIDFDFLTQMLIQAKQMLSCNS